MSSLGIILFIAGAVEFLSANDLEPSYCIQAEELCLQDPQCNSSYHVFEHCSQGDPVGQVYGPECHEAALVLQQSPLMNCKCQHRMRREEHCLKVYWTVHPVHDTGDLDLYSSPYEDKGLENMGSAEYNLASAGDPGLSIESTNACLIEADSCSNNKKCSRQKTAYVTHCSELNSDGLCDRRRCHRMLRNFFEKVPEVFTKRLLFCPCKESYCAERRRQTIVPECSFEEKTKKNCLQLYNSCIKDIFCRSHLADFQKNCYLFDKTTKACPMEQHGPCMQSYIRMIGTVMTPNYINNSSMDISLWCTCEGSGNQQDDCKTVLGMFTSNRCLKNAINAEINGNNSPSSDSFLTVPKLFDQDDADFSVISGTGQALDKNTMQRDGENQEEFLSNGKSMLNTASGVSCPSLALTLLSPMLLFWLLKIVYVM
ncbi:GDNF family receptor alpha-3 [Rhinophrynus dorsalis]